RYLGSPIPPARECSSTPRRPPTHATTFRSSGPTASSLPASQSLPEVLSPRNRSTSAYRQSETRSTAVPSARSRSVEAALRLWLRISELSLVTFRRSWASRLLPQTHRIRREHQAPRLSIPMRERPAESWLSNPSIDLFSHRLS